MATPEEIEQAAVGATLKMEELGYEVFELPRHDERGIAVLLASKGKEQRLVCAVNKNNHKNDWTIPKAFEWFTSSLRLSDWAMAKWLDSAYEPYVWEGGER